ncbi:MAG: hypothetical protein QM755_23940 [Luteolibacter sp.]
MTEASTRDDDCVTDSASSNPAGFSAPIVHFNARDEYGSVTVAFQDDAGSYVLASRTLEPTAEDVITGTAGIHLEIDDQLHGCYDGIGSCLVFPERIFVELNERGYEVFGRSSIEIHYELPGACRHQLKGILELLFDGFPCFANMA